MFWMPVQWGMDYGGEGASDWGREEDDAYFFGAYADDEEGGAVWGATRRPMSQEGGGVGTRDPFHLQAGAVTTQASRI